MSQNKERVRLEAWSAPRLPLQSLCLSFDLSFDMLLSSHIIKHNKSEFCRFLAEISNLLQLSTKTGGAKKQKVKKLLVKKQKWEEKFTDILDWQNQGTRTMQTDFRLLKLFCYLFTWMWCAALFLTQNYWQYEKKNKQTSSCTLIKPLSYPGRGENVQVKKLNGTSHPCPHPRLIYRKNIQNIDRRQWS